MRNTLHVVNMYLCVMHLKAGTGPYVDTVMSFCIEYLCCLCAARSLEYLCMFATIKDCQQMNARNIKENISNSFQNSGLNHRTQQHLNINIKVIPFYTLYISVWV